MWRFWVNWRRNECRIITVGTPLLGGHLKFMKKLCIKIAALENHMPHIVQSKFSFPASWTRAFAVTLFFVTLSAGLFWLDFFRSYSAEVTVLVVSRPTVSQSGQDVAGNLAALTRTLSFYDRVLVDNDLIDDPFDGYAPDKRKEFWNNTVIVKKLDGGSVLSVRAVGNTPEEATLFARQTAQTLFSVAGLYYNVKTDIDLRIIDGPLLRYVLVKPFLFGGVSLFTGFFVTALFFLLLNALPGFIVPASPSQGGGRKREPSLDEILTEHALLEKYDVPEKAYPEYSFGETVPWIDPRKFIPAKPKALSFENMVQEVEKRTSSGGMRAPAPANLPVAPSDMELPVMDEAELPFEFETPVEESEVLFSPKQGESLGFPVRGEHSIMQNTGVSDQDESASASLKPAEPTADEYKRRLNELLSGNN